MIAVSSWQPQEVCSPEIWKNQMDAVVTWGQQFDDFKLIESREPPAIRDLCEYCSQQSGWSCIINADIIVGPNWRSVEQELNRSRVVCAISKRYELGPDRNPATARVVDNGLDIFIGRPEIWALAAKEVPEVFRLGKIFWDTWMLGFFMYASKFNCADITESRVIFHPRHGGRRDQNIETPKLKYPPIWPGYSIKVPTTARLMVHRHGNEGGGGQLII